MRPRTQSLPGETRQHEQRYEGGRSEGERLVFERLAKELNRS
jgi:hypothetical protein